MSQVAHIVLRPVEPSDLPLFFEHQRDPIAVEMVAFQSRDRAAFDEHWTKILADETGLIRTIVVTSDVSSNPSAKEHVAGNIVSWNSDGKREIGYWIDRACWGRGIATGALSAFLRLEQTRSALRRRREAQCRLSPRPAKMRVHVLREPRGRAGRCGCREHRRKVAEAGRATKTHLQSFR